MSAMFCAATLVASPPPAHHLGHRGAGDERPVIAPVRLGKLADAVQVTGNRLMVRHSPDERLVQGQAHVGEDPCLNRRGNPSGALRQFEGQIIVGHRHFGAEPAYRSNAVPVVGFQPECFIGSTNDGVALPSLPVSPPQRASMRAAAMIEDWSDHPARVPRSSVRAFHVSSSALGWQRPVAANLTLRECQESDDSVSTLVEPDALSDPAPTAECFAYGLSRSPAASASFRSLVFTR